MGTSNNALFPRLRRQRRARILRYHLYTAVLRAVLPCTHEKITLFRGAHIYPQEARQNLFPYDAKLHFSETVDHTPVNIEAEREMTEELVRLHVSSILTVGEH